jgi:mono/diheme cytochrome c family protein
MVSIFVMVLLISCKNEPSGAEMQVGSKPDMSKAKTPLQISVERGAEIYKGFCTQCHMPNGKGVAGVFPPLNPSDWLTQKRKQSIHAIKYGLKGPIVVNGDNYDNIMLPLGLSDQEVADVMNYTLAWNLDDYEMVTVEEVAVVSE